MKRCPLCKRQYQDDISFCLQDGTPLSDSNDFEKTLFTGSAMPPTIPGYKLIHDQQSTSYISPAKSANKTLLVLIIVTVSTIGAVLLFFIFNWVKARNDHSIVQNTNSSFATPVATPIGSASSTPEVRKNIPQPTASAVPEKRRELSEKIWYVMLGGYKYEQSDGAYGRLAFFRRQGYSAYIVDTNDYDNFDPNLFAVVMGPYSRSEAERIAEQIQTSQPDVYIKWARKKSEY